MYAPLRKLVKRLLSNGSVSRFKSEVGYQKDASVLQLVKILAFQVNSANYLFCPISMKVVQTPCKRPVLVRFRHGAPLYTILAGQGRRGPSVCALAKGAENSWPRTWRYGRVAYRTGLLNRRSFNVVREFESHCLRQFCMSGETVT